MSYHLQIWSVHPADRLALKGSEQWDDAPIGWTRSSKGWQITVSRSDRVVPEDIPDDVAPMLPGIQFLTGVNLEGSSTARRIALSVATALARNCHGVLIDQEKGTAKMPSGVTRLLPPGGQPEIFSTITFSWWFLDSPFLTRPGRDRFLRMLARDFSECLPRRYGPHAPPQYTYTDENRSHFLDVLEECPPGTSIRWYARWPVVHVYLGLPESTGGTPKGFRSNYLTIEVETAVLGQPGWNNQLRRFWIDASRLIRPFYGDIRILGGRVRRGTRYCATGDTEQHPISAWWWRGIPTPLGMAVVLGAEYQELWPQMVARARVDDGLAFVTTESWKSEGDLADTMPVPEELAAKPQPMGTPKAYPIVWPFESPFTE
jgi:hypothetical protein